MRNQNKKPVLSNNVDIICLQPKASTTKKKKKTPPNSGNVPRANNKKKKTILDKSIIWVHNEIDAEERNDPARYIEPVVDALTIGEDEVL